MPACILFHDLPWRGWRPCRFPRSRAVPRAVWRGDTGDPGVKQVGGVVGCVVGCAVGCAVGGVADGVVGSVVGKLVDNRRVRVRV